MLEVTNQLKHLAQRWGLQFNSIAKIEDEVIFLYTRKVQGEILAAPSIRKNEPGQRIARGASLSSPLSGWHYKGLILLTWVLFSSLLPYTEREGGSSFPRKLYSVLMQ